MTGCFKLTVVGTALCLIAANAMADDGTLIAPDDSRISFSDYVHLEQASDSTSPTGKTARFDRILDMAGRGYRWDNPGTRIRFRTDAATIDVLLRYSERHTSTSARNPIGHYLIDGKTDAAWTFRTQSTTVVRQPEMVSVAITSPAPGSFHNYEIVLPYADSVEFQGLRLPAEAHAEAPPAPPAIRYVAYGDSITQGFTCSEESHSYTALLAEKKGWQLVNMGFGGRSSTPSDGAVLASLTPDVITVLMGVNNWQGGGPVDAYRSQMDAFISGIRSTQPNIPIYLITPLWVAPSWKPAKASIDLEQYRQALRDLVAARSDTNLHLIEGPTLIDHDAALFDSTPVHPNDRGFAQMADRLAAQVSTKP